MPRKKKKIYTMRQLEREALGFMLAAGALVLIESFKKVAADRMNDSINRHRQQRQQIEESWQYPEEIF